MSQRAGPKKSSYVIVEGRDNQTLPLQLSSREMRGDSLGQAEWESTRHMHLGKNQSLLLEQEQESPSSKWRETLSQTPLKEQCTNTCWTPTTSAAVPFGEATGASWPSPDFLMVGIPRLFGHSDSIWVLSGTCSMLNSRS